MPFYSRAIFDFSNNFFVLSFIFFSDLYCSRSEVMLPEYNSAYQQEGLDSRVGSDAAEGLVFHGWNPDLVKFFFHSQRERKSLNLSRLQPLC